MEDTLALMLLSLVQLAPGTVVEQPPEGVGTGLFEDRSLVVKHRGHSPEVVELGHIVGKDYNHPHTGHGQGLLLLALQNISHSFFCILEIKTYACVLCAPFSFAAGRIHQLRLLQLPHLLPSSWHLLTACAYAYSDRQRN